jgi:hypothetical protein
MCQKACLIRVLGTRALASIFEYPRRFSTCSKMYFHKLSVIKKCCRFPFFIELCLTRASYLYWDCKQLIEKRVCVQSQYKYDALVKFNSIKNGNLQHFFITLNLWKYILLHVLNRRGYSNIEARALVPNLAP